MLKTTDSVLFIRQLSRPAAACSTRLIASTIVVSSLLLLSSCKDDEEEPVGPTTNSENLYVNDWIKEGMDFWYLWNTEIPSSTNKNLPPDEYFSSLLSDDDRFSWIQNNYQELLNSLQGINKEAGYEYVLYRESSSSDAVVAQITYIKKNSPAEAASLKRGDVISKINGTAITVGNYRTLIEQLDENHTIVYRRPDVANRTFSQDLNASLTTLEYQENPNFFNTIIERDGKKIGYFVYNFFATGTNGVYDNEMDAVFANFKSQGITDLVLDLRYNSGGSETSAKNLASLVGKEANSQKIFFKRQYNSKVTEEILKDANLGEAFLTNYFSNEASNVGSQLQDGRVYILTSSRTASASELIINSLKPYMDVFIIGDVTAGKNVGSISLYEENDARNKWGMQPIVVKVANRDGFADYGDGFPPNVEDKDNDLFIYPLGDSRENLLAEAIEEITGVPSTGRVRASSTGREVLFNSLDLKGRSNKLIMEGQLPEFD